jgi:hypothetical protein
MDNLKLYYDKENKQEMLRIGSENILSINKRQIDKDDVNKLSIHYSNGLVNALSEIKLKAANRRELEEWIGKLRVKLAQVKEKKGIPTSYSFLIKNKEQDAEILLKKYRKEPKGMFVRLSSMELIFKRKKADMFIERLKIMKIYQEEKNNEDFPIILEAGENNLMDRFIDKNRSNINEVIFNELI